jgi:hypothetical protein
MAKQPYNPANSVTNDLPKDFVPMTQGRLKLEVPDKPGYHRHWFIGEPQRLERARRAGYVMVDPDEVNIASFDLAGDGLKNGNTLGSEVSIAAGAGLNSVGAPLRLYLMECPMQYYEAGQAIIQEQNDNIAAILRGGKVGVNEPDMAYNKEKAPNLFTPRKERRP